MIDLVGVYDLEPLILARLRDRLAELFVPDAEWGAIKGFQTIASESALNYRDDIASKGIAVHIGPGPTTGATSPTDRTRAAQTWIAAVTWPLPSEGGWYALGKAAVAVVQALHEWKPGPGLPPLKFTGSFEPTRAPSYLEVDLEFTTQVYWPGT